MQRCQYCRKQFVDLNNHNVCAKRADAQLNENREQERLRILREETVRARQERVEELKEDADDRYGTLYLVKSKSNYIYSERYECSHDTEDVEYSIFDNISDAIDHYIQIDWYIDGTITQIVNGHRIFMTNVI